MAEQKTAATPQPKGYFVGEIEQQTPQGRLLVEVAAKPDGTAMTPLQAEVEILNKLDLIYNLIKSRL